MNDMARHGKEIGLGFRMVSCRSTRVSRRKHFLCQVGDIMNIAQTQ